MQIKNSTATTHLIFPNYLRPLEETKIETEVANSAHIHIP